VPLVDVKVPDESTKPVIVKSPVTEAVPEGLLILNFGSQPPEEEIVWLPDDVSKMVAVPPPT
jgi:hypothetical protein